jgi:hypothetical protein
MKTSIFSSREENGQRVLTVNPSILGGVTNKIVNSYEIVGGHTLKSPPFVGGSSRVTAISAINSIEVQKSKATRRVSGVGTLVFFLSGTGENDRIEWKDIPSAEAIRDYIWSLKLNPGSGDEIPLPEVSLEDGKNDVSGDNLAEAKTSAHSTAQISFELSSSEVIPNLTAGIAGFSHFWLAGLEPPQPSADASDVQEGFKLSLRGEGLVRKPTHTISILRKTPSELVLDVEPRLKHAKRISIRVLEGQNEVEVDFFHDDDSTKAKSLFDQTVQGMKKALDPGANIVVKGFS